MSADPAMKAYFAEAIAWDADRVAMKERSVRVAWRVAKDWLEACLALIAAQMTTIDTVMLPFLHVDGDKTLWEAYREREQAAIEIGESS